MTTKIKKGDFIEVEYTGKVKEDDAIFDTTDEKIAKEIEQYNPNVPYGPLVICLGEHHILEGLENQIGGKEPGKYTFELSPEQGFGKKDAKLLKLIPLNVFKKQDIMPHPGLQVNMDGVIGIIKTVTGGRVLVDFNHPLSGREIIYEIKVNKIVSDDKEKVASLLKLQGINDSVIDIKEAKAKIFLKQDINDAFKKAISDKITKLIPSIKSVEVAKAEEVKSAPKKPETKKSE